MYPVEDLRRGFGTEELKRQAMCDGKERFTSENAAWAAIGVYARLGHSSRLRSAAPYLCEFCNEWHYGH